jgi:hypothetical protein
MAPAGSSPSIELPPAASRPPPSSGPAAAPPSRALVRGVPGGDPATAAPPQAIPVPKAKPEMAKPIDGFRHAQAVPVRVPPDAPKLAIVMDDLGLSRARTMRAVELPAAVTLSFLTYADGLPPLTAAAREAGHEVLAHVPMQPRDTSWDAGKNVLTGALSPSELTRRLDWALARVAGKIGVNNHMGSAFTADRAAMRTVLATLKARGLMFLDSRTTPNSLGAAVARELGVAFAARDVFLDNARDPDAIRESLERAVAIARDTGAAVAIGHPYPVTFDVLEAWIPKARQRGVAVVPLSDVTQPAQATGPQTAARAAAE